MQIMHTVQAEHGRPAGSRVARDPSPTNRFPLSFRKRIGAVRGVLFVASLFAALSFPRQLSAQTRMTAEEVDALVAQLKSGTPGQRDSVIARINHAQDPKAISALFALAESPNPALRRLGIWSLAALPVRGAEPVYLKNVGHPEAAVREAAILALGHQRTGRHWQRLVPCLKDENPIVRRATVMAFGRMGAPGLRGLAVALSRDVDIRLVAIEQLAQSKSNGALKYLRRAARQGEASGRVFACRRLRSRDPKFAFRQLEKLSRSSHPLGVRLAAINALTQYPLKVRSRRFNILARDPKSEIRAVARRGLTAAPATER